MLSFEWDQEPRRLPDLDLEQLEAGIRRGRSLQARAMGQGFKALVAALVSGQKPAGARTGQGKLDWEQVLGLAPKQTATTAAR